MIPLGMEVKSEHTGRGAFRFYPIGDLHLDSRTTDQARIKSYISHIADDPHAVYVVVGDLVDGTTPSHRFFEPGTIRPEIVTEMGQYVRLMIEELTELFLPLANKPGLFIQGNHDIRKGIEWSGIVQHVAMNVGARYGGDECMVRLRASRGDGSTNCHVWTVYAHHGAGGGMFPGGKTNRAQNTIGVLADADIYVRGHVHDSDVRIIHKYGVSKSGEVRLTKRPRAFVTAPSFSPDRTQGVNNYAGRKGYPPNDQGIMFLHCHNPRTGRHSPRIYREEWRG